MQVTIRLIGAFRTERFKEKICEYPDGTRIEEIVNLLQISQRSLGSVLVNGVHARLDATLEEGDTLALLPILGGG